MHAGRRDGGDDSGNVAVLQVWKTDTEEEQVRHERYGLSLDVCMNCMESVEWEVYIYLDA